MAFVLSVLLLTAGVWSSAEAQEAYTKLTEPYRIGVDLALQQVSNIPAARQHFLFFKSVELSHLDVGFGKSFFYHHFYLKATTCAKGTENPNSSKCPFRNDRPLLDCVACYNIYNGNIEPSPKPYIHCIHKPILSKESHNKRRDQCFDMNHISGGGTLLAQKSP